MDTFISLTQKWWRFMSDVLLDYDALWILQIIGILILTALTSIALQRVLLRRLTTYCNPQENGSFFLSLAMPVRLMVWILGVGIAVDVLHQHWPTGFSKLWMKWEMSLPILVIGWALLRALPVMLGLMARRYPALSTDTFDTIQKIATCVIVGLVILMALPTLGISISGLLAFGGVGGIIVGLAAKDLLSNVLGAFMLHVDRPFSVGDWVHLPEKNIQGTVEEIGWRQVLIRTFDKKLVFVPNSIFGNLILINPGRMTHRRFYEILNVRYVDLALVSVLTTQIADYLKNQQAIDQEQSIVVSLDKYNSYSVDLIVSAFTRQTEWADFMAVKQELLLHIATLIHQLGADFAFPTQELHWREAEKLPISADEPERRHS
jgi:MscS family membrane protein